MNHIAYKALIVVLLSMLCSFVRADIVTLRDGTVIEGVVVKENGAQVVIEVTISNIKTTRKFPRYKVKSIEHKPIISDPNEKPKDKEIDDVDTPKEPPFSRTRPKTHATKVRPTKDSRTLVMVIPIEDILGVEVNAKGLDAALSKASSMGINHVVFDIKIDWKDKRSGYVPENPQLGYYYAARNCLEVLDRYKSEISYYSVIEKKCTPQLLIFLASSKQIFVRPRATLGARVVYPGIDYLDTKNPIFDIEAEALESLMPDILKVGVSNGYSQELLKALLVKENEAWINRKDAITITDPADGSPKIDDALAPTVLSAEQMRRIGFAARFPGTVNKLGALLEVEHWRVAKGLGARLVRPASNEYEELNSNFHWTMIGISKAMSRLEFYDPRNNGGEDIEFSFPKDKNGQFLFNQEPIPSEMARLRWKKSSNRAIANADIIITGYPRLKSISDIALDIGMEHLFYPEYYTENLLGSVLVARDWIAKNKIFIPRSMYNDGSGVPRPSWKMPKTNRPKD